jgi:hypothetical protein
MSVSDSKQKQIKEIKGIKGSKDSLIPIQVIYQPDRRYHVTDTELPARQIRLNVSRHHYWGMLLMSYALFGGSDNRIQFQEQVSPTSTLWRTMKLAYLNSMIGPYVIAQDPIYCPHRPCDNWSQYLASFAQNKLFDYNDFTEFTGHLIGRSEVLVRFPDLEFLQGAILICLWFNLEVSDYIHNLKYNWKPFTVVPKDLICSAPESTHPHLERHYYPEPITPDRTGDLIKDLDEPPKPEDIEPLEDDMPRAQIVEDYVN